jgi:hypothetical protein
MEAKRSPEPNACVLQEPFGTVKSRESKRARTAPRALPQAFIYGTGEMARLTRAFDWSRTPVGPIAISGIIVLGVDVTESKRAEKALMQTEKLAAVGRLASSIAHEINNTLESVTNLLFLPFEAVVH